MSARTVCAMLVAATLAVLAGPAAVAGDHGIDNADRARSNYLLHCRGCHTPDGSGVEGKVPRMRGHIARFLSVPGGREYLLRVPGAANAPLDDAQLAELMNWILVTQDPTHLPAHFRPYTTAEVGRWRDKVFAEVEGERRKLVGEINAQDASKQ